MDSCLIIAQRILQINPGKLTVFIWSIQIAITPKIIGYNLKYNFINSMLKYER